MLAIALAATTCWVCALVARPRRPLPGNEVQERVYSRLLSRHQRVALLAIALTAAVLLVHIGNMPSRPLTPANDALSPQSVCYDSGMIGSICYTQQPEGMWIEEQLLDNGTWRVIGISQTAPPPPLDRP